jgi:hypothetical protein
MDLVWLHDLKQVPLFGPAVMIAQDSVELNCSYLLCFFLSSSMFGIAWQPTLGLRVRNAFWLVSSGRRMSKKGSIRAHC